MSIEPQWIPYWEYLKSETWIFYNQPQSDKKIITEITHDNIQELIDNPEVRKKDLIDFMLAEQDRIKHLSEYQMLVVLWLFLWDEWKWTDAYKLALEILNDDWLVVSSIGWPNAWHDVILPSWKKFTGHNIPWAAATWKDTFLWQWKFLNVNWLKDEITDLFELEDIEWTPNIYIAQGAHCIFSSFHGRLDWIIEESKSNNWKTWTTNSWMWPVNATEAFRTWITMGELLNLSDDDLKEKIRVLLDIYKTKWFIFDKDRLNVDDIKREVFQHRDTLKDLIKHKKAGLVKDNYAQIAYKEWRKIILEWSQSIHLWKHAIWQDWNARYPYVTSWDTSFTWNLNPLWIDPKEWEIWIIWVYKVIMSAVWNHPDFLAKIENLRPDLAEKIKQFARETWEKWWTTWRPRDLWFPDLTVLENFISRSNQHTAWLTFRKMDRFEKFINDLGFDKIPMIESYDENNNPNFIYVEPNTEAIMRQFVKTIDAAVKNDIHYKQNTFNKPIAGWFWAWADDTYVMNPNDYRD